MVKGVNANFVLSEKKYEIIKGLVSAGTYDSISEFFRVAVDEHLARYTDIPTLLSLDRRVKLNKAQIDKMNETDRTQNRRLTQIEEKIK